MKCNYYVLTFLLGHKNRNISKYWLHQFLTSYWITPTKTKTSQFSAH